jgi:UDP-glucose 4-epimerase
VLRYANAYGPRQDPHHEGGVVAIFAYKVLNGIRPTIYGDGLQTRDFVHVKDLVRANLACLDRADGESLNLGTGVEVTVAELFAQIAVMADVAIEPQYEPERQGEMRRLSLNSSRAEQILEWKPQVGLTEGLGSVLAHFKEN